MSTVVSPLPRVLRPQRALPSDAVRPTRAEINLGHLRHNLHTVKRAVGDIPVWAVLKADGYGHGAKAVARTLERDGVAGVCVALVEEGIELREAGIRVPILVIGGHYGRAWSDVIAHGLTPMLHDPGQVEALADEVRYLGVDSVNAFLSGFLLGQDLTGEQGEAFTLTGQDAFCRSQPTRCHAPGLRPFKDAVSDFHCQWGRDPGAERQLHETAV